MGSGVSSPSGVGTLAEIEFGAFYIASKDEI